MPLREELPAPDRERISEPLREYIHLTEEMARCAKLNVPPGDGSCSAAVLIPRAAAAIRGVVGSGVQWASDVPYSSFVPEIVAMSPDTRFVITMRDPLEWARRRFETHPNDPLCKPGYAGNTSSWFSIWDCLRAAGDATLAWTNHRKTVQTTRDELGEDRKFARVAWMYERHEAYIAAVATARKLRQVCIFDEGMAGLAGMRLNGETTRAGADEDVYVRRQNTTSPCYEAGLKAKAQAEAEEKARAEAEAEADGAKAEAEEKARAEAEAEADGAQAEAQAAPANATVGARGGGQKPSNSSISEARRLPDGVHVVRGAHGHRRV